MRKLRIFIHFTLDHPKIMLMYTYKVIRILLTQFVRKTFEIRRFKRLGNSFVSIALTIIPRNVPLCVRSA